MHEQKVNTNDGEKSPEDQKNLEGSQSRTEVSIDLEHGKLIFDDCISLRDHAEMRSQQLCALLRMTYGQHAESFEALGHENRNMFHWHVHQMAVELDACLLELSSAREGK